MFEYFIKKTDFDVEIHHFQNVIAQLNLQLRYVQQPREIEEKKDIEWTVICTQEFHNYWKTISEKKQIKIATYINYLEVQGIQLGYPHSSDIKGSSLTLRELRPISSDNEAVRVFYRFTPQQRAILLCVLDESQNKNKYYDEYKKIAISEYRNYLDKPNSIISFTKLWCEMKESARHIAKKNFMIENSSLH